MEVNTKHADRVSQYNSWKDKLNFTGLEFIMEVEEIWAFERLNPEYATNVFAMENSNVRIPRLTENKLRATINLLVIVQDGQKHYFWIKDMSRL